MMMMVSTVDVVAYFSSFRVPDVTRIRFELHCFRALFAGVRRTRSIETVYTMLESRGQSESTCLYDQGVEIEVRAHYVSIKTAKEYQTEEWSGNEVNNKKTLSK